MWARRAAPGTRAPRGFAPGFRRPGFRPGLWSTGPTARPGTWGRPVGPPNHSPGRNPGAQRHTPPPPNIPQGMNDHTRVRVFAPCRGARWGVCNTPLHGYDHSGHRPAPWYGHSGPWGPPGGAYAVAPPTRVPASTPKRINNSTGRRPQHINNSRGRLRTAPAGAGKLARYPAKFAGVRRRPRGLGKCQNAPLNVSDASESSKTRR